MRTILGSSYLPAIPLLQAGRVLLGHATSAQGLILAVIQAFQAHPGDACAGELVVLTLKTASRCDCSLLSQSAF